MKPVLKCEKLFILLNFLKVKINNFEETHSLGYHSNNIPAVKEYAKQQNLFSNLLSDNEIIISKIPIWLGKKDITYQNGIYTISYHSRDEWRHLKKTYNIIKHMSAVPKMTFPNKKEILATEFEGEELLKSKPRHVHKVKFMNFLEEMNHLGYAHRDLHCKNILISEDELIVIDWDFVIEQKCDILHSYDLTGRGLSSPHRTDQCHIFKSFPKLGAPSVAELLNITWEDFEAFNQMDDWTINR